MEKIAIRKLTKDDIEVKVKQVFEGGALLLLYKTARVDMAILDEVYGPENWTTDYKEIKGNLYCGIGIRTNEDKEFVWKWDCGIESREDDEGNQKKGEASDAFKRAGFKVGIGRELYSTPLIFINAETKSEKGKAVLSDKYAKYSVKEITYNDAGEIQKLIIVDKKGVQVFPKNFNTEQPEKKQEPVKSKQQIVVETIKGTEFTNDDIVAWIKAKTGTSKRVSELDDQTFDELIKSLKNPKKKPEKTESVKSEPVKNDDLPFDE